MGMNLIMSAVVATTVGAGCSWAHPGANPYRGDPQSALADFAMSDDTRRQLHVLMAAHRYTDAVTITRDGIVGQHRYADLRLMHSGHGQFCQGQVDRSAWSPTHEERGLVYCVGETCVVVPTVCNNVSRLTLRPEEGPVQSGADEPIDISPAAGPPAAPADVVAQGPDSGPLAFLPTDAAPGTAVSLDAPEAGGTGGTPTFPNSPGGGGGGGGIGLPTPPGGGGGACCDTGPIGPGGPGSPPVVVTPTSPVPETPTWALLLAGLSLIAAWRHQRC
jgi:hypothetical protein